MSDSLQVTREMMIDHMLAYPYRFKTESDAAHAMVCIQRREPIPRNLVIFPFIELDGKAVPNSDYVNAPFEIAIFRLPKSEITTTT